MPSAPRIFRAIPEGVVTRPAAGISVIARLHWHGGDTTEVAATAVAWTARAVEIDWTTPWGDRRRDWVPADQVRRARGRATPPPRR